MFSAVLAQAELIVRYGMRNRQTRRFVMTGFILSAVFGFILGLMFE